MSATAAAPRALPGATSLPPGPSLPGLMQMLAWILSPTELMRRCQARYGDRFTIRMIRGDTLVFLSDPADIAQVFTGDPARLHAGAANEVLLPLLGSRSVLLLDDAEHMRQRKLMLPAFHGERMQAYGELMAAVAAREIDAWPRGEPFAVWPHLQAVTLEVILRAVFGIDEADRLERLRAALVGALEWTTRPTRLFMFAVAGGKRMARSTRTGFRRSLDPVDALLYEEIRRRRADGATDGRDDILSMLLGARDEDGEPMSDRELRDELMTLLVAGHETTATALAWAIERLVATPPALQRLTGAVAAGETAYLDAVISETLRLRPVLPIVLRQLTQDTEIAGHLLPAGTEVAPCIWLVHRRPDLYPDPEAFRPERFLGDGAPDRYSWIPFGGGVRRCLGASFAQFEMRVVLGTVFERVALRAADAVPARVGRRSITLTPRGGVRVVAS